MSLYGALFSGVSGLSSQASAMGAIADNVTNVNTIGYKGTKVNFQTLITKQVSLTKYSAGGVQSKPRQGVDVQGLLQSTSNATDIAISGQGFFVVNEAANPVSGNMFGYTRAGGFKVDREGFLQNVGGWYMQGWPLTPWDSSSQAVQVQVGNDVYMKAYKTASGTTSYINDNIVSPDHLKPVNLNEMGGTAQPTRNIRMGLNLPSTDEIGDSHKTNVLTYDSLGADHNLQYTWTKTETNKWDLEVLPPLGAASLQVKDASDQVYSSMGRIDFLAEPQNGDTMKIVAGLDAAGTAGVTYTFNFNASGTDDLYDTTGSDTDQAYDIDVSNRTASQTYDAVTRSINHSLNCAFPGMVGTAVPTTMQTYDAMVFVDAAGTISTVTGFDGVTEIDAATIATKINGAMGSAVTAGDQGGMLKLSTTSSTGYTVCGGQIGNMGAYTPPNANDTVTFGTTVVTFDGTEVSLDDLVDKLNLESPTTGVKALNSGGNLLLYTADSSGVAIADDSFGVLANCGIDTTLTIGSTMTTNAVLTNGAVLTGTVYAERLESTDSIVFRNPSTEIDMTVDLYSMTANTTQQQSILSLATQSYTIGAVDVAMAPATTDAIVFNGDGTPASIDVDSLDIIWANGAEDQAGADAIGMFLGNINLGDGMTQFSGSYQIGYINQNGAKFGNFASVSVGSDGIVTAMFDNGVTRPVFMVPVVTFVNPNGMESLTGNVWIETDFSGQPTMRTAGDAGAGSINSAALEASTVDLGEEFTTMITTQRAYSASAKIITTSDEMLDELVRIKR